MGEAYIENIYSKGARRPQEAGNLTKFDNMTKMFQEDLLRSIKKIRKGLKAHFAEEAEVGLELFSDLRA